MSEEIEKQVAALVKLVLDADLGDVKGINIHIQASGEHPFTVNVPEAIHPPVGLAIYRQQAAKKG